MRLIVTVSPQFDLCYALAELLAPEPLIPAQLFGIGQRAPRWLTAAGAFGWSFWLAVPDVLEDRVPAASIDEFVDALAALPPERVLERVRRGLFHSDDPPSSEKREWLHFVGLDDAGPGAAEAPDAGAVPGILGDFCRHFEPVWLRLLPALERSAKDLERLAGSSSFPELAARLDLAIDGGEPGGRFRALRGGWSIATADVDAVYLIPSAFNPRRLCHAADERLPATLFFPYRAVGPAELGVGGLPAPIDPWLVARAVGDPTRAAIVRRIAAGPRTASSLLAELGLSKATISHHIFQLRQAGLVEERRRGKAILLSLNRATLEGLGSAFRRDLARQRREAE